MIVRVCFSGALKYPMPRKKKLKYQVPGAVALWRGGGKNSRVEGQEKENRKPQEDSGPEDDLDRRSDPGLSRVRVDPQPK